MAPNDNAFPPCACSHGRFGLALLIAVSQLLLFSTALVAPPALSLVGPAARNRASTPLRMGADPPLSDGKSTEIARQLERAKAALATSRAKMEAQERAGEEADADDDDETPKESLPFFAAAASDGGKKDRVIKDKNEDGLFTTDGDLMAKLSEEEQWESRPLTQVFQDEIEKSPEAMNIDRDIGQSMYNLRKTLQTEDFTTIFDKRNRFIGEA